MAPDGHGEAVYRDPTPWLWVAAVAVFVIGDAATTHYGLIWGAYEANTMVARVVEQSGVAGFLAIKAIVCVAAYAAFRAMPRRYAVGIPMGLSLLGSSVVTWNLAILVVLA